VAFFHRHDITFKKKPARRGAGPADVATRATTLDSKQGMLNPARLVFIERDPAPAPKNGAASTVDVHGVFD